MSMFPHTVTLYIPRFETDPETLEDRLSSHITLLRGVLLDETRGVTVGGNGQKSADHASLYIPFGVTATDGVTGKRRMYAAPAAFRKAEDPAALWTLTDSEDAFFIKGEAVRPDTSMEELEGEWGAVFRIVRVAEFDYGTLRHWEVEGK